MGTLGKDRRGKRGGEEIEPKVDSASFLAQLRQMSPPDLLALIKRQTHEIYELDMQVLSHADSKYMGTIALFHFFDGQALVSQKSRGSNFPSFPGLKPIQYMQLTP